MTLVILMTKSKQTRMRWSLIVIKLINYIESDKDVKHDNVCFDAFVTVFLIDPTNGVIPSHLII